MYVSMYVWLFQLYLCTCIYIIYGRCWLIQNVIIIMKLCYNLSTISPLNDSYMYDTCISYPSYPLPFFPLPPNRASVTTFTRSNQGFGEEEGLATGGVPMQAGMDEGARMDHGGGRQHGQMLGAAGILHKPEEEGLSPQVGHVTKSY